MATSPTTGSSDQSAIANFETAQEEATLTQTSSKKSNARENKYASVEPGRMELRDGRRHVMIPIEHTKATERLMSLTERTMDGRPLSKPPIALANLSEAILMMLLEDTPHSYSQELAEPTPAPWHVKRAMDFMRANLAKPITIEDVACVCNVNIRTLQQGFRQFRNTTPKAFLRKMRLEAAHRQLCMAGPEHTVADIALMWGFMHLGRFAIEYRKLYGRHPSETLRKK